MSKSTCWLEVIRPGSYLMNEHESESLFPQTLDKEWLQVKLQDTSKELIILNYLSSLIVTLAIDIETFFRSKLCAMSNPLEGARRKIMNASFSKASQEVVHQCCKRPSIGKATSKKNEDGKDATFRLMWRAVMTQSEAQKRPSPRIFHLPYSRLNSSQAPFGLLSAILELASACWWSIYCI